MEPDPGAVDRARVDPPGARTAAFPDTLHADRVTARVVPTPFLDPQGERLRG